MSAADIVEQVRISHVWRALGGGELRRAGHCKYRGQAWWREGDGWSVSLDDARGVWHDHRDGIGGGMLDLVAHIRGGDRHDALRWLASLAGFTLDDKPLSSADKAAWARHKREVEGDLPIARLWRRAAVCLAEEILAVWKATLCDGKIDPHELLVIEGSLAHWQVLNGAALVASYRAFLRTNPRLCSGMVKAALRRQQLEERVLWRLLLGEIA